MRGADSTVATAYSTVLSGGTSIVPAEQYNDTSCYPSFVASQCTCYLQGLHWLPIRRVQFKLAVQLLSRLSALVRRLISTMTKTTTNIGLQKCYGLSLHTCFNDHYYCCISCIYRRCSSRTFSFIICLTKIYHLSAPDKNSTVMLLVCHYHVWH